MKKEITIKEVILDYITELLEMNYEIKLSFRSIVLIEIYKSLSRDEWIEKEIYMKCGLEIFSEGTLRITEKALREQLEKIKKRNKKNAKSKK